MPETVPLRNTLSRRYSTTRPLGFRGGSIGPGGNLQPPTAGQVAGINPPTEDEGPPLSQFTADVPRVDIPRPPSFAANMAGTVGSRLAAEGLKSAGKTFLAGGVDLPKLGGGGIFNPITGAETFAQAPIGNAAAPVIGESLGGGDTFMRFADAGTGPVFDFGTPGISETFPYTGDVGSVVGTPLEAAGGFAGDAVGAGLDAGGFAGDALDFPVFEGAGEAAGAAFDTSGIPVVGPLLRLAQGDVKGAAGSAVGGAIGSAILPGIGTAIGSFLGGTIGSGCFITEAVMAAGGQGDAAPELEVLRGFRDNVLAATPQGQALIQEYTELAPLVVEAVVQRPDAMKIFQSIDAQFINPAVEAINQGDYQKAVQIYSAMISYVTPFAAEVGEETLPSADMGAMRKMGEHAAIIGHSPEMAGIATGDMGMAGMDDDPTGYDGGPQGAQGQTPIHPMMQQFARPRY